MSSFLFLSGYLSEILLKTHEYNKLKTNILSTNLNKFNKQAGNELCQAQAQLDLLSEAKLI